MTFKLFGVWGVLSSDYAHATNKQTSKFPQIKGFPEEEETRDTIGIAFIFVYNSWRNI